MNTLDNLTRQGWTPREGDYCSFPCDVCGSAATFVRMDAPDCDVWGLAGVGGAHSDAYGVWCGAECVRKVS